MLFRQKVHVDWQKIKADRQAQSKANNAKENKKRLEHDYKPGDLVLLVLPEYERKRNAKISPPTVQRGPFEILNVYKTNGTVRIKCGAYTDTVSIRRIRPYNQR